MQKSIAEKAVFTNPNNSFSLYLLGEAQFASYDLVSQSQQDLDIAIQTLETSLALEGKEAKGEVPETIKSQKWFQEFESNETKKSTEGNQICQISSSKIFLVFRKDNCKKIT